MAMNPRLLRPKASGVENRTITLVSTKSSGDISLYAVSTTNYVKVTWWDNTSQVVGPALAEDYYTLALTKAVSGAGSKTISLIPCDASGKLSGHLTNFNCYDQSVTQLSVAGLKYLTDLECGTNALTELNLASLPALANLSAVQNQLTSLDLTGLNNLTTLQAGYNALTSLTVANKPLLSDLILNSNLLTSLTLTNLPSLGYLNCTSNNQLPSLNVSGLAALNELRCSYTSLTSLDVSGLTALARLQADNCSLTSIRAIGVSLSSGYYTSSLVVGASAVSVNSITAAALNQFFTDLASGVGFIQCANNPGSATCDPTIATAKGYTVFTT